MQILIWILDSLDSILELLDSILDSLHSILESLDSTRLFRLDTRFFTLDTRTLANLTIVCVLNTKLQLWHVLFNTLSPCLPRSTTASALYTFNYYILHADTQSSGCLRSTCPNHLSLPRLTTTETLSMSSRLNSSAPEMCGSWYFWYAVRPRPRASRPRPRNDIIWRPRIVRVRNVTKGRLTS